jgi:hypothetical protein
MELKLSLVEFASIIGIICGILFGLALLIVGFVKKNIKFGILGFILSLIISPFLSLIGVLPVFGVFLWLILRKPAASKPAQSEVVNENSIDASVKDAEASSGN